MVRTTHLSSMGSLFFSAVASRELGPQNRYGRIGCGVPGVAETVKNEDVRVGKEDEGQQDCKEQAAHAET